MLLLFDVDGTLTKPRQKISEHMKSFLIGKIKPLASIGLVGNKRAVISRLQLILIVFFLF